MAYMQTLHKIIGEIVASSAAAVDQNASFPRASMEAFGKTGFLGLISAKEGGGMGLGLGDAARVIEALAQVCPSTAMVLTMHYCGTAVLEKQGSLEIRKEIAKGNHFTTLAWSEVGSRSHFWAPVGTARKVQGGYSVSCQKTMVTSAMEADSYVWSSQATSGNGASTLWLVQKNTSGLKSSQAFNGLGLRGNASAPMASENMVLPESAMLGNDGGGFDTMIGVVLPLFSVLNASCSLGIIEGSLAMSLQHVTGNKFEHLNSALSDLPTIRAYVAKARIRADMVRTLRDDTVVALKENRPDAMLRVMQVKAAAADAALDVTDICMRVCGGAAFRKDVGMERLFRDARAAHIMAPTSDVLFDFIGKAICNMPVFG
ncbi:MAG TPA: acyl-CoA dehydrogenase family protein [Pseudobdellovibrionaceae bacterium]